MKKILLVASLLTILCMFSSGCSRYLRPAVLLPSPSAGYEVDGVAVAVDFSGVKHIARRLCPIGSTENCYLDYLKVISGNVTPVWTWTATDPYSNVGIIDIAVTDDGTAVIAWETMKYGGTLHSTLYVSSSLLGNVYEIYPTYQASNPKLASKLNVIYVVQEIMDSGYSYIWYRQLQGGSSSGWVSDHGATDNCTLMDASVSPGGDLYVVFKRWGTIDIMYADNYGTTGDMTNRFILVGGATDYTTPRIDVNGSPAVVYITYTHEFTPGPGVSDLLVIGHCPANSCSLLNYESEQPLNASLLWNVSGSADVIADAGSTAYYVFQATNSDTVTNVEIFEGYFQEGLAYFTANVSDTTENDGVPSIGLMWSIIPVTGWVTGNSIYQFDTYPFIAPYASLRVIYQADSPILTQKTDLYTNADWGAGAWVEEEAVNKSYVIYNVYPAFLPLLKK